VLVAEMVEDRAAGEPDGLFQPAHGGAVVAEFGEAAPGTVEYLATPGSEVIVTDLRHGANSLGVWVRARTSRIEGMREGPRTAGTVRGPHSALRPQPVAMIIPACAGKWHGQPRIMLRSTYCKIPPLR